MIQNNKMKLFLSRDPWKDTDIDLIFPHQITRAQLVSPAAAAVGAWARPPKFSHGRPFSVY